MEDTERLELIEKRLKDNDERIRIIEKWLLEHLEEKARMRKRHVDILERCKSEPAIMRDKK